MSLPPNPHPGHIIIVAEVIVPTPGAGRQAPPCPLAFGATAKLLLFRRPGIGIVFSVAMMTPPLTQSLGLSHPPPSFPLEGYDAAIAIRTQFPWLSLTTTPAKFGNSCNGDVVR